MSIIESWPGEVDPISVKIHYIILPEAVPSINYIGRQLDVSYIGRQVYGEIIHLSDKNLAWDI